MGRGAMKLAREGETPHLGEPPVVVVVGVGEHESGPPARPPAGAVLEIAHEPLQRPTQAASLPLASARCSTSASSVR